MNNNINNNNNSNNHSSHGGLVAEPASPSLAKGGLGGRKAGRPATDPSWRSNPGAQNIKAANMIKKKAGLTQSGVRERKFFFFIF
jgi:hypothetical protein